MDKSVSRSPVTAAEYDVMIVMSSFRRFPSHEQIGVKCVHHTIEEEEEEAKDT